MIKKLKQVTQDAIRPPGHEVPIHAIKNFIAECNPVMILKLISAAEAAAECLDATSYSDHEDEIGRRVCCGVVSYKPHSESCSLNNVLKELKNDR